MKLIKIKLDIGQGEIRNVWVLLQRYKGGYLFLDAANGGSSGFLKIKDKVFYID